MIAHISGTVIAQEEDTLVVDVGGVGYAVMVTREASAAFSRHTEGGTASLWTHLAVRETSLELFGFQTREELDFFEKLIAISGIGPRSALAILNLETVATLKKAILAGDTSYLTKVSGIGSKSAQKIVLELKDKLDGEAHAEDTLTEGAEVLEALVALGYSARDARDALKSIDASVAGTQSRVKEALKKLGGNS